jgi:hypothetical protein
VGEKGSHSHTKWVSGEMHHKMKEVVVLFLLSQTTPSALTQEVASYTQVVSSVVTPAS